MHMAAGKQQANRVAQGTNSGMDSRGQAAATLPDGLGVAPSFPTTECLVRADECAVEEDGFQVDLLG